jgi:hypothetical protein
LLLDALADRREALAHGDASGKATLSKYLQGLPPLNQVRLMSMRLRPGTRRVRARA